MNAPLQITDAATPPPLQGLTGFPDAELVRLIRVGSQGDAEASTEELVRRYEGAIFGTLLKLTHSHEDAEDLAQEAFVKAFQKLDSFDNSRPFKPWLFRLAVNLGISSLRTRKQTRSLDDSEDFIPLESKESGESLRETLDRQERLAQIREALQQLPAETQTVFQLHYHEGFALEEIAHLLDKNPGAVRTAMHRARAKVREWFGLTGSTTASRTERPES